MSRLQDFQKWIKENIENGNTDRLERVLTGNITEADKSWARDIIAERQKVSEKEE